MQFRAHSATLLFIFALATNVIGSGLNENKLPQAQVISESSQAVTVRLTFATPVLRAGDVDMGESSLIVHVPGATPIIGDNGLTLPALTRYILVPDGYNVKAHVLNKTETTHAAGEYIKRDALDVRSLRTTAQTPLVEVGEPGWMRYMRVAPVTIYPTHYLAEEHEISALSEIEIEFEFTPGEIRTNSAPDPDRYGSLAFEEFFASSLLNPRGAGIIPANGKVIQRGSYIIITDSALARTTTSEFAEWKRSKGFDVVVAPLYYRGIQTAEIKNYIQDAYDNWDRPPEFILLLGDVNMPGIQLPTYFLRNPNRPVENDASDLQYVLLEGDDYFPDAFIGRISCDSPSRDAALKAFARIIRHERDAAEIVEDVPDAYNRATLFAGNFGESARRIVSPVETSKWLGERLRELDYDVEEFYYEEPNDDITPDRIVESINRGVNIVSYRGWADANGPHYPQFYKPNLDQLDNGPLLPVFTFFVCNTGDFANNNVNPCFGEYSITRGSRNDPTAALSFFGPSDLHTSTKFNNPMLAGYYTGLLYEGLRVLGPLTLRSKMEVYRGFPHLRGTGEENYVEFYFSIYNILGDPEVNLYLEKPFLLDVDHPEALSVGDSYTRIVVRNTNQRPVKRALVTLRKDDETEISVLTDANGVALIPVTLNTEGTLKFTVIAYQAAAYSTEIPVTAADDMVGLAGIEIGNNGLLVTGTPVDFTITLRNTGTSGANAVSATLSSPNENIEIIDATVDYGNIASNGTAEGNQAFSVQLSPSLAYLSHTPFELQITDAAENSYRALFRIPVADGALMIGEHEFAGGSANPGSSTDLIVTLANYGNQPIQGVRAELYSHDESIVFEDDNANFGNVDAHSYIDCSADPFVISVQEGTRIGRRVELGILFYDGDDIQIGHRKFKITIGEVDIDDPIGPDGYGYYAYEDIDDADYYSEVPTFDWIELDPDYEGENADEYLLDDDTVVPVDLPFTFRYYGRDFERITICDNGWLSFGETWMNNFRNWGIPSPLGPHSMVMPFWDDLTNPDPDAPTDVTLRSPVKVLTRYDQEQDRFVIEWSRATNRQYLGVDPKEETFEVILYDPSVYETLTGDGEILFQYLVVNNTDDKNNFATVGIQDWNHRSGLQVTYSTIYHQAAAELRNERAIKFTTNPPDDFEDTDVTETLTPERFTMSAPHPNPFNASTTVSYTLPESGPVTVTLWDQNGRLIDELYSGHTSAGTHTLTLKASDHPSGVYFINLNWMGRSLQSKALLLK